MKNFFARVEKFKDQKQKISTLDFFKRGAQKSLFQILNPKKSKFTFQAEFF